MSAGGSLRARPVIAFAESLQPILLRLGGRAVFGLKRLWRPSEKTEAVVDNGSEWLRGHKRRATHRDPLEAGLRPAGGERRCVCIASETASREYGGKIRA